MTTIFVRNVLTQPKICMCDKQFPALQSILQSLARRMPQIILRQVEEIFLVVRKAWWVFFAEIFLSCPLIITIASV